MLVPVVSPFLMKLNGGVFVKFEMKTVALLLFSYRVIPLILGMLTRHIIIKRKGKSYFLELKKIFPGMSAIGILIIVFFSVAKVSRLVLRQPVIFLLIFAGLTLYYLIQTFLSIVFAKALGFKYEEGMIMILGAVASSQAISLSVAATAFSPLTVFALSFKPVLQVFYIMFLIYFVGPRLKSFLGTKHLYSELKK